MNISITDQVIISPEKRSFEVVERKGIGHPDSLSDLLADEFSRSYSNWALKNIGIIPNHWVDKVNIVGGSAKVQFGSYEMVKPINCYLFGKITDIIGERYINIMQLFEQVAQQLLLTITDSKSILDNMTFKIDNSKGVGVDHDQNFYSPNNVDNLKSILTQETLANDTAYCIGYYPFTFVELLVIKLENYINSNEFQKKYKEIGTDVKVLVSRLHNNIDITTCIPFHPEQVPNISFYHSRLKEIKSDLTNKIENTIKQSGQSYKFSLNINTKDGYNKAYLTPFGTCLGKGDCGVVGRGNKYNGLISAFRPSSVEAPAGKNPVHHAGKIYSSVAQGLAILLYNEIGIPNQVTIVSRNGCRLDTPAFVHVDYETQLSNNLHNKSIEIIQVTLQNVHEYAKFFLNTPSIERFRNGMEYDLNLAKNCISSTTDSQEMLGNI